MARAPLQVLDVKPYVPFADSVPNATVAPWLADLPTPDLEVRNMYIYMYIYICIYIYV